MLRTFFGLKPNKIRTFEGFFKVLCSNKKNNVYFVNYKIQTSQAIDRVAT